MKRNVLIAMLTMAGSLSAGELTVEITTDPPLPAQNLLPPELSNFATNTFSKEKVSDYRNVQQFVKPGHEYILACEIKPSREVSTAGLAGGAGLGCSLTYWDKTWKKAVSLQAKGEGPDRWQRVVSPRVMIPDWIGPGQLTVGLSYSDGSGQVRNIELFEAGCELVVEVKADKGVAQVKIVDENLVTVFDSGVLSGNDTVWTNRVKADAAHRYSVYAIDTEGEIKVKSKN